MKEISIRPASLDDLKTLLVFEQGIVAAERPMDPFLREGEMTYYDIPKLIGDKQTYLVVAVCNNELVGSGYIRIEETRSYHKNPQKGYIGFMYVKPEFRGNKISNIILAALKEWAEIKDLKELRLDVYHNNPAAIKSYKRFGFKSSMIDMRMEI